MAIVTGDYFLDDPVSAELSALGAALTFKPLWLETGRSTARSSGSTEPSEFAASERVPVSGVTVPSGAGRR